MKLLEDSVLLLMIRWLKIFPWMKDQDMRSCHHYEHVYTGLIVSVLIGFIPSTTVQVVSFIILMWVHVLIKEGTDCFGKKKQSIDQTKVDLTTRLYGMILGGSYLLVRYLCH